MKVFFLLLLLVVEPDYLPDLEVLCFLVVFIPHEDFTPQKYVHSSMQGSAEGGGTPEGKITL
jgi:hypothetical protein